MLAFVWMLIAAFVLFGLILVSIIGFGLFIGFLVNLILLPFRIILWFIRMLFGIF